MRAGEIAEIGRLVADVVPRGESLIFGGDFNTDPHEFASFAEGVPPAQSPGDRPVLPLQFSTGIVLGDGKDAGNGADGGGADSVLPLSLRLEWGHTVLREAFEALHRWSKEASEQHPTSRNSTRSSHIDYIFFTPSGLRLVATHIASPTAPIPCFAHGGSESESEGDAAIAEPSDHVPICATFELLSPH